MKLLSIDVGIKNLAYCLFEDDQIMLWDVINLCGQEPNCSTCTKKAKFSLIETFYCPMHAKKSQHILPTANISLKKVKKMKLIDLQKVASTYNLPPAPAPAPKKEELLKQVLLYLSQKMLQSVATSSANDMDLVKLGIALRKAFDHELKLHLATIDYIVIENQISPIANRMKSLQGMIAQYFIMHDKTKIVFVSAANKLKGHANEVVATNDVLDQSASTDIIASKLDKNTYADRKKTGIKVTLTLLNEKHLKWLPHFNTHKKKDDLADAFLQGNWFLNNKI